MAPRCYIAGALGFTEAGRHYYAHVYLPELARIVDPVDPWALTSPQDWERAREARAERELALEIGRRNTDAIRSCTLLAALLEGQEVDAGTAAEVGYAAAVGLTCFGLRSDLRRHGEDGMAVNLQLEAFIAQSGGRIVRRLGDLVEVLRAAADASA